MSKAASASCVCVTRGTPGTECARAAAVAVYASPRDEIVIRRQGGFDAVDDVVAMPLTVAEALLRRMESLIRELRAETALS